MADITMCNGFISKMNRCPLKDTCYRHTANPNDSWQCWFVMTPYDNQTGSCEMYWPTEEETNG